jgi:uncharacterized protein YdhG (YjbR/CyaY superfamily)
MTAQEIDDYLAGVDEPKRSTLESLRRTILEILPTAEQCISYQMPAFRVDGKVIVGFAAFKNHIAYLPHSGSVLDAVGNELAGYTQTKGSLHLPVDVPPSKELVEKLIAVRLQQLGMTT